MLGAKQRPTGIYDSNMLFKDAGLVDADAAGTVDAVAKVVDLGTGLFKGQMFLDVTACEVDTGDEKYEIYVQLSSTANFASAIRTAAGIELGDAAVLLGDADTTPGRYKIYFDNEHNKVHYRYARIYTDVTGTIATGINFSAYCVKV